MELIVNGKNQHIDQADINIKSLLGVLDVDSPAMVSVQLNGEVLQKDVFETQTVKDGDEVNLLYFMGGGAG